jgi:hypothetical protein
MDAIDQLLANLSPNADLPKPRTSGTDPLIAQIKAEQVELEQIKQQEIDRDRNEKEQLKQQRLEQLKQQRRTALHHRAETWLANLAQNAPERRWFDEFACNYNNRTDAAIAYLEALEELNDLHP